MTELPLMSDAWRDLPGTITLKVSDDHSNAFMRNAVVLLVEHDISPASRPHSIRYAGYQFVTRELLADAAALPSVIDSLDWFVRPWLYPERYRWPTFDLFPRLTRLRRRFAR